MMLSKLNFQPDVDAEKKKEEWQGSEPAPDIKDCDITGVSEGRSLSNQNLTNQKPAQNEKQFDPIETEMAKNPEHTHQVRVKNDKTVGTNHTHYCRSPEKVQSEDALSR